MSKKLFAVLSLLIVFSMLFAACGNTDEPVDNGGNAPADNTAADEPADNEPMDEPADNEPADEPADDEPMDEPEEEPEPEVPATTRVGGWLDTIAMSVVSADSAVTQIEAGAIDIYASNLSTPQDIEAIEAAGLERSAQFGLYYELTFNPAASPFTGTGKMNPFASDKVREAMNWLVDRDYINQEIYGGTAVPKFFSFVAGFPEYARYIDIIRPLEAKYSYNKEKAVAVITEEMEAMGAEMVDGKWTYEGEPVTLIFLIRTDSDGTRRPMGDIISNWLEEIGFTVDRQYKTSSEASPLWVLGDPNDGLWHLYTGAWGSSAVSRDDGGDFQFFATLQSVYAFSPLWQEYAQSEEYTAVTEALANKTFTTLEERKELMAQALEGSFEKSYRVWIVDGKGASPWTPAIGVSYDLSAGVDINRLWPYTLKYDDSEGGLVKWADPDMFVDPANPIAGSNWTYDSQWQIPTNEQALLPNPFTGVPLPQRIEKAEVTVATGLPVGKTYDYVTLEFSDEIAVPGDAYVGWDVENKVWMTADEKYPDGATALRKSVSYYPANTFDIVWHDGSSFSAADIMMGMIMTWEVGLEGSDLYDESQAPVLESFLSTFKGFRFVSMDPLVVEYYSDTWFMDAENNITTLWPEYGYGNAAWHTIAVTNMAESKLELAYSADKADGNEIEWMNLIGGPSLEILAADLDEIAAAGTIPFEATLGAYITAEEAAARYANLQAFYAEYGHFWVGTGPYILKDVFLVEKTLTLVHNPNYIDLADKWMMFSEPQLAEVAVDGPGRVTAGDEAVFDVLVTFKGDPYPAADIAEVKFLLFDATGELVEVAAAELVEDGHYTATLTTEMTEGLESGANKIEVVVVAIPVSIPGFGAFEFVVE